VSPALVKIIKAQNQALALHSAERERKRIAQRAINEFDTLTGSVAD
jgi:hypothetical protein